MNDKRNLLLSKIFNEIGGDIFDNWFLGISDDAEFHFRDVSSSCSLRLALADPTLEFFRLHRHSSTSPPAEYWRISVLHPASDCLSFSREAFRACRSLPVPAAGPVQFCPSVDSSIYPSVEGRQNETSRRAASESTCAYREYP